MFDRIDVSAFPLALASLHLDVLAFLKYCIIPSEIPLNLLLLYTQLLSENVP